MIGRQYVKNPEALEFWSQDGQRALLIHPKTGDQVLLVGESARLWKDPNEAPPEVSGLSAEDAAVLIDQLQREGFLTVSTVST